MEERIWQNEYEMVGNDYLLDEWGRLDSKVRWGLETGELMSDVEAWDARELEPSEELVERLRSHKDTYLRLTQIAEALEERVEKSI